MRYLILSDIHANFEAFAAVMNSTRRKRWDKAVCLGDIVGYAAEVN
jgi:predicted phosphodiesterase